MNTNLKNLSVRFRFGSVFFLVWLAACSSDPVATVPVATNHQLRVGDNFRYGEYSLDEAGMKIAGSDTSINATVVSVGQPLFGKPSVTVIAAGSDTTYVTAGSDSSITIWEEAIPILNGISLPGRWFALPQTVGPVIVCDSTISTTIAGMEASIAMKMTSESAGKSSMAVATKQYAVINWAKIVTVTVTLPAIDQTYTTVVRVDYSYIPALGYFGRKTVNTNSNSSYSPMPNGSVVDSLVSMTLQ
jgi:hypothetical protein